VHAWHIAQPKAFLSKNIQKHIQPLTKCVNKLGDCMEKLCSSKFSVAVVLILKYVTYFLLLNLPNAHILHIII